MQDPAVDNIASFVGADGVNPALNSGRMQITLKPKGERDSISEVMTRMQQSVQDAPNSPQMFIQPVQIKHRYHHQP